MFQIIFQNELGTIEMGGGQNCFANITDIAGLGAPQMERNTVRYAGQPGQILVSTQALPRVITIAGTVRGFQQELTQVTRILHRPGVLYLTLHNKRRRIHCVCTELPDIERMHQSGLNRFVLQFTCDNPHFTSFAPIVLPIYGRQNTPLVDGKFTLPRVFTVTSTNRVVEVLGDEPAEPILSVRAAVSGIADLHFENLTTGSFLKLVTPVAVGDVIVADISSRKIIKNGTVDITNDISDDTFLYRFTLPPGENEIAVTVNTSMRDSDVSLQYAPIYWEAVR